MNTSDTCAPKFEASESFSRKLDELLQLVKEMKEVTVSTETATPSPASFSAPTIQPQLIDHDDIVGTDLAIMRQDLERRLQRMEELFPSPPVTSATPSPPSITPTAPSTTTTAAAPTPAPTPIDTTTTWEPVQPPPAMCSTVGRSHGDRALAPVIAAPASPWALALASYAPAAAPATSPTRCSTVCLSCNVEMFETVNTFTTNFAAPPILVHFSADLLLDTSKYSFEWSQSRYISTHYNGVVLFCLKPQVYGAPELFEIVSAQNLALLQPLHASLVDKGQRPSILQFDQVSILPKPPWPLVCLEADRSKGDFATQVTWMTCLLLTDSVKLRPIPWPSFDCHIVAVPFGNLFSLVFGCSGSKCETSQLLVVLVVLSYSVWIFPSYNAAIGFEIEAIRFNYQQLMCSSHSQCGVTDVILLLHLITTTRTELPVFVTWLWQRGSHMPIKCYAVKMYSIFLSRNGYRVLILKFLLATEPLSDCIVYEYGLFCHVAIQFQQQQLVYALDYLHGYFIHVGGGHISFQNMHYSVAWAIPILYCINDRRTLLLIVTWQWNLIRPLGQTCSLASQAEEIVLLSYYFVHVLFVCYLNGVAVQSFLPAILHYSFAYNDELATTRLSKYSVHKFFKCKRKFDANEIFSQRNGLHLVQIEVQMSSTFNYSLLTGISHNQQVISWNHCEGQYFLDVCNSLDCSTHLAVMLITLHIVKKISWTHRHFFGYLMNQLSAVRSIKRQWVHILYLAVYHVLKIRLTVTNQKEKSSLSAFHLMEVWSRILGNGSYIQLDMDCMLTTVTATVQVQLKRGGTTHLQSHIFSEGVQISMVLVVAKAIHITVSLPFVLAGYSTPVIQIRHPATIPILCENGWDGNSNGRTGTAEFFLYQFEPAAAELFDQMGIKVIPSVLAMWPLMERIVQAHSGIQMGNIIPVSTCYLICIVLREVIPAVFLDFDNGDSQMMSTQCYFENRVEQQLILVLLQLKIQEALYTEWSDTSCPVLRHVIIKLQIISHSMTGFLLVSFLWSELLVWNGSYVTPIISMLPILFNILAAQERKCWALPEILFLENVTTPNVFLTFKSLQGLLFGYLAHIGEHNGATLLLKLLMDYTMASSGNSMVSGILISAIPSCQSIQFPVIHICAHHISMASRLHRVPGILISILRFYCLVIGDP